MSQKNEANDISMLIIIDIINFPKAITMPKQ